MFTKKPEVFITVKKRMKNNLAVGNLKKRYRCGKTDEDIEFLIDQVIFETLSLLEELK